MTDTVLSAFVGDTSQMLSTVAGMSARPAFNLAFSNLQTLAATRYNDQVSALQQRALDSYDVNLDKELSNLQDLLPKLQDYQNSVNNARNQLIERLDQMSDIDTLNATLQDQVSKGQTVDDTEFNAKVDALNNNLKVLPFVDGSQFDDYGDSGIGNIRLNGVGLKHFSADGNTTPPTGSSTDLLKARTQINDTLDLLTNRLDIASGRVDQVSSRISEIQSMQQKKTAEIKADVAKQAQTLKLQLAQQLQAISVAFEAQQGNSDQLTKAFTNDTYQVGSVVNLFS
jgi:hypothetical protein